MHKISKSIKVNKTNLSNLKEGEILGCLSMEVSLVAETTVEVGF